MNKLYLKIGSLIVIVLLLTFYFIFSFCNWEKASDAKINNYLISLYSKVEGKVIEVNFGKKNEIKKGQILAKIDDKILQEKYTAIDKKLSIAIKELNLSKEEVDKISNEQKFLQNEFKNAKINLENANEDFAMYQISYKDGTVTKKDLNKAIANLDVAQQQYEFVQAKTEKVKMAFDSLNQDKNKKADEVNKILKEMDELELELSYVTIVAPKNGIIIEKNIKKDDVVKIGTKLFVLAPDECVIVAKFDDVLKSKSDKKQELKLIQ